MKRWAALLLALFLLPPLAWAQLEGFATSTTFPKANAAGGTTEGLLAKVTATGVTTALTTDTAIPLYLVTGGAGTTGTATLTLAGPAQGIMDATNASGTAGWFVVASVTTNGRLHAQATAPSAGYVVGYMLDDATTNATKANIVVIPQPFFPAAGAGSGTVTSAALTVPAEFSVSGSPITTAGTLAVTKATQTANTVWAGPVSGGAAQPAFRALVTADIPAAAPGGAAGGDLAGTYPNPTVAKASGAFSFPGDISPTALSGNVNDYSPSGFSTAMVVRIDGGAADRTITGLAAGGDEDLKLVQNVGTTNALTLVNQSANSAATGRFLLGGDVTLFPGETQSLIYDATPAIQRWRPFGAARLDAYRVRTCQLSLGSPSASAAPLADDEDSPDVCGNDTTRDWVVTSVACKANAGTPTITPILTGGTATSILTGALTCTTSWSAGTVNGTPTLHSFSGAGATCSSTPCTLDLNVTTAGGVASYIMVRIVGVLR